MNELQALFSNKRKKCHPNGAKMSSFHQKKSQKLLRGMELFPQTPMSSVIW